MKAGIFGILLLALLLLALLLYSTYHDNEKAIEINPQDSPAWYNKGNALGELGKFDGAIKAYDKAIEIDPYNLLAWQGKGYALVKLNRFNDSIKAFNKAIEIRPQDSKAWYNRACIYSLINNKEKAIFDLKQAIKLDPVNRELAKRDPDFKKLLTYEQFASVLFYEKIQAAYILTNIENGNSVNLTNCLIVGKLDLSTINLENVSNPYFDIILEARLKDPKSYGVNENLSSINSSIIIQNSFFEGELNFSNVQFRNTVFFKGTIFSNSTNFAGVNFNKDADFSETTFNKTADFFGANFNNAAHFNSTTFNNAAHFNSTTFNNAAHFNSTTFNNIADFYGSTFENSADFYGTLFKNPAYFNNVHFNDYAYFTNSTFKNSACFDGTTFNNPAYFARADFNGNAQFTGPNKPDEIVLDGSNLRMFRRYYSDAEQYEDANTIYFNYRKDKMKQMNWNELKKWSDIFSWLIYGYGVKPFYALRLGVVSIFLFSIIYANPICFKRNRYKKISISLSWNVSLNKMNSEKIPFKVSLTNPGIVRVDDPNQKAHLVDIIYYSINCFTFVSHGNWYPKDNFKKWETLEGVLGWLTLGIFMTTLGTLIGK